MKANYKNLNENNTLHLPKTAEEILDTLNLTKGNEMDNRIIFNSWSDEQKARYYEECASRPKEKRRSPWEVVLASYCKHLFGAKVYEVYYNLSDELDPVAVVASKRRKDGTIDPASIHTIVHYTPYDIEGYDIALLNLYSEIVEETYGIHPRLAVIGKEFDNDVIKTIMEHGRDVSVFANKKD